MHPSDLDPAVLLEIIGAQAEITKFGSDLGAVMEVITRSVQSVTRAEGAILELAEGDEMVYRAASGMAQAQIGLRLKREGSLSGLCVAEADVLHCRDADFDPRVDREACRRVGLQSMVCAPLVFDGSVIGVLKIASSARDAFTPRDIRVLELMTGVIAAELHRMSDVDELHRRATHDPLTGIPNRARFYDRLRQELKSAEQRSVRLGILVLDIDGLHAINERHGHLAGDAALREATARIRRASRQNDTVARLQADTFGIILAEARDWSTAEGQAHRLRSEFDTPFRFGDHTLTLDAGLGFAIFPDDGRDLHALIEKADRAVESERRARKATAVSG